MQLSTLKKFVIAAGIYNFLLALGMFTPVITETMGLLVTDRALASIIGVLLIYTAVVQIFAAKDLKKYGWLVFWEGLLRWAAAAILIPYGLYGHLGKMAAVLGLFDFIIGCVFVFVLPQVLNTRLADLTNPKY